METVGIVLGIIGFLALVGVYILIRVLIKKGVHKAADAIHNAHAKKTLEKDLEQQNNLSERYK